MMIILPQEESAAEMRECLCCLTCHISIWRHGYCKCCENQSRWSS